MRLRNTALCVWLLLVASSTAAATAPDVATPAPAVSEATTGCLECHEGATPGIVADWRRSLHARTTPAAALGRPALARRMSATSVPDALAGVVVGCAECHGLAPDTHADSVEHGEGRMHVVVTPRDCATCHPEEAKEYAGNLMSEAYGNLMGNALYGTMVDAYLGHQERRDGSLHAVGGTLADNLDACLACHGSAVVVTGTTTRETSFGDVEVPVLAGWPNQGVGRVNPDGSKGSCAACHTRHQFSIAVARRPATCAQCHKGPDVPAAPVYEVSKHGNLYHSLAGEWDFDAVPWRPGTDFTAPTCAACHASLLTNAEGEILAPRTHRMNDRLDTRLFGLVYAHAHPAAADTTPIRSADGLSLPTALSGAPASAFLIDADEQARRRGAMKAVCAACHATSWTDGHFAKLDRAVTTSNAMVRTATDLVREAWDKGLATGPAGGGSAFDEPVEILWTEGWLFHANSVRFSSAMGGADYGVFASGRFHLARTVRDMAEWLERAAGAGTPKRATGR